MTVTPHTTELEADLYKRLHEPGPLVTITKAQVVWLLKAADSQAVRLDVAAMTETLRYLYHADGPCDAPDKHRHDHIARGIVGQYPRLAALKEQP